MIPVSQQTTMELIGYCCIYTFQIHKNMHYHDHIISTLITMEPWTVHVHAWNYHIDKHSCRTQTSQQVDHLQQILYACT